MASFDNMDEVRRVLRDIPIPDFFSARQRFETKTVADIPAELDRQLRKNNLLERVRPGASIAITVGSRQIAGMPEVVRTLVTICRERGARPFVIPAMGSHGGATAEGQREILIEYGISEETVGAPIYSDMETVQIGLTSVNEPVWAARHLLEVDGIIVLNRIKAHPGISGAIESGITKMAVIGLGKQKGAETCHREGLIGMSERIQRAAQVIFEKLPVLFGVGLVENAYDRLAEINCIPTEQIAAREPEILRRAKSYMPRILPSPLDVLVIDEIGKNISGMGADPTVFGRYITPGKQSPFPGPTRIVMLGLTEETRHAAGGIGQADFITRRLYDEIDYGKTYINCLTSSFPPTAFTPVIMPSDKMAIQAAIKTCGCADYQGCRVARIRNTLAVETILLSRSLYREALDDPQMEVLSEPAELRFDEEGNLLCP